MKQLLLRTKPFRSMTVMVLLNLLFTTSLLAQEQVVTGKVVDENGVEMPGVSILLKGTSAGTTTKADGTYVIALPQNVANPVLVFSFIGYGKIEEAVGERTTIDVPMQPDVSELAEVVVVGYGAQSKAVVTGAVVTTAGQDLVKKPDAQCT